MGESPLIGPHFKSPVSPHSGGPDRLRNRLCKLRAWELGERDFEPGGMHKREGIAQYGCPGLPMSYDEIESTILK